MIITTTKLTDMPLRTSLPFTTSSLFSYTTTPKTSTFHSLKIPFCFSSSLRTNKTPKSPNPNNASPSKSPWLSKCAPQNPPIENATQSNGHQRIHYFTKENRGQNAIERIVLRLRNLGLGTEEEEEEALQETNCGDLMPLSGEDRLADLLKREWVRSDTILAEDEESEALVLPWEREEREREENGDGKIGKERKRRLHAPTLAELTLEDEELRRLRRMGMLIRERITIPKAGLTKDVLQKIHDKWRKNELVRLKFHEVLARDMKTAHELVELTYCSDAQRRTGGLVIWRAGSVMVVFRGSNYEGPPSKSQSVVKEGGDIFVPDVSSKDSLVTGSGDVEASTSEKREPVMKRAEQTENMTEEEAEYNHLLDGLGPRFEEWWGTGILPIDADMLPRQVPVYKTPFRLLPTGMRSRLTGAELTKLRKLAKSLPCHFALGRNRNHQGLANAILKLWEKSVVVKIAVKRGIQNTNNKLMAEELKNLTGGVLLLRNKYFIVMYRGKDFLPTTVAATLAERQELTKQIQDVEEKVRSKDMQVEAAPSGEDEGKVLAGTLAEFYDAQARWGRDISTEEREKMIEEAEKAKGARLVKQIEHRLAVAQAKKLRAERLLAKIEATMIPSGPDYDQETITDEERAVFRKMGLKMKAYLPIGMRGVFDGVIENMHLHWKHRELVKLISKQKTLAFVQDTARLLEYESGGILVAIERVPKGFALIYYRGKNYQRPISLRPRNLLTKAKALKHSVAMQRHEALSQHISELEKTIEQMKKEIGLSEEEGDENKWNLEKHSESEDEASCITSDWEEEEEEDSNDDDKDLDWKADKDFEFSSFEYHDRP